MQNVKYIIQVLYLKEKEDHSFSIDEKVVNQLPTKRKVNDRINYINNVKRPFYPTETFARVFKTCLVKKVSYLFEHKK